MACAFFTPFTSFQIGTSWMLIPDEALGTTLFLHNEKIDRIFQQCHCLVWSEIPTYTPQAQFKVYRAESVSLLVRHHPLCSGWSCFA